MILPLLSRSIRSMGWITRLRTRTTSPGLIDEGRRTRTLPMSDTSASAAADGHLDLALHREQRAVPHRPRAEDPLEGLVDRFVLTEGLRVRPPWRLQREAAGAGKPEGAERRERPATGNRMILHCS